VTCAESLVKQTIHAMKKAIILGSVFSVLALMLVSCASEPEATTTTTRQTTVTTAAPQPVGQTTTTTTHRMGGGY
jgi:starvation-inducible outer membrane lipoprotein